MKLQELLVLLLVLAAVFGPGLGLTPEESSALTDMYNAWHPVGWKLPPACNWTGITCNSNGDVTQLDLPSQQLQGPIPQSIGNLFALEWLDLSGNDLTGELPNSLGNLSSLESLDLANNKLNGSLPESLGDLQELQQLHLGDNQLSGPIPTSMVNLQNLIDLGLSFNNLDGSLPSNFGNLQKLVTLELQFNSFSGSLPSQLGELTSLQSLNLQNNGFTGDLPEELSQLTQLITANLQQNQFTGAIPDLSNLSQLTSLQLNQNSFTGQIDSWYTALTNLTVLRLDTNSLTGSITDIFSLPLLSTFTAAYNNLTGIVPESICNVSNIAVFPTSSVGYDCPLPTCCPFGATNCSLRSTDLPQICESPLAISYYVNSSADDNGNCTLTNPCNKIEDALQQLSQTQPTGAVDIYLSGDAPFHPPKNGYALQPCITIATRIIAAQGSVTIDCQSDTGFIARARSSNNCTKAAISFIGVAFQSCSSAISIEPSMEMAIYLGVGGCSFDDCKESAIYHGGSALVVRDTTFTNCENRQGNGGSINAPSLSEIAYMSNITVINSQVKGAGGAFFINSSATVTLIQLWITNASSQAQGGAIFVQATQLSQTQMSNITTLLTQSGGDGGSLAIVSSGNVMVSNTVITTSVSSAGNGGGLSVQSSLDEDSTAQLIQLSVITAADCSSLAGSGGALSVNSSMADVVVYDINITSCGSQISGGGSSISTSGSITLTDVEISSSSSKIGSTVQNVGGGLSLQSLGNQPTFLSDIELFNCSAESGGGIYISNSASGEINVTGLQILDCSATLDGGGVFLQASSGNANLVSIAADGCSAEGSGSSLFLSMTGTANASLSSCRVANSISSSAIYCQGSQGVTNFDISNIQCNSSKALRSCGGCLFVTNANAYLSESEFYGSSAKNGGAICFYTGATVLLFDHLIIEGNNASLGGGVSFSNSPAATITNSQIRRNCASSGLTDGYSSPSPGPKFDSKSVVTNCKGEVVVSDGRRLRRRLYIIAGGVIGLLILIGTIVLTWYFVSRKQKKKIRELDERERLISERERNNPSSDGYLTLSNERNWATPQYGSSANHSSAPPQSGYAAGDVSVPDELKLVPSKLEVNFRDHIGKGGTATVYRGRYNGEDVAIKHLMPTMSGDQLEKEMLVWFKIRHPNVVTLIGVTPPPDFFMVMELMECSLQYFLANVDDDLSWADRMSFVRDISKGLNHVHQTGLIHRDLKAANVLLSRTLPRTAKLADFGLARELRAAGAGSVDTVHYRAGTFSWMAPELFENEKPTKPTDIYGFAMVCYEILSLREPWKNLPPASVVREITVHHRRPPLPTDLNPPPPAGFFALIEKCWAQAPNQRPASEQVLKEVEEIIETELDWNMDGHISTWLNLAGLAAYLDIFLNMRIEAARQISHLRGNELEHFMMRAGISAQEDQQKLIAALRRNRPAPGYTAF